MKEYMKLIISLITLVIINSQNSNGITVDISQDVLNGFNKQFLPILVEQLGQIYITDTSMQVDAVVSKLHINITDIHINIRNITNENIILNFKEPNIINIKSKGIHGTGFFRLNMKMGIFSYSHDNFIEVNNIFVDADLKLTSQESPKVKGKMLPSGYISRINISFDYDFSIYGNTMVEAVSEIAKSTIKNYINKQLNSKLIDIVTTKSKEFISELVNDQPVYVPINYKNLALDVSLLSPPAVVDGNMILHINGSLIKLK